MSQFLFIFTVIVAGFITGQVLKKKKPSTEKLMPAFVFFALRFTVPISLLLAIWQLPLNSKAIFILPFLGFAVLLFGFGIGLVAGKFLKMTPHQIGAYAPAGGYTNMGVIGSLASLVFLGESGIALVPLVKLFEEIVYYAILFPYAARCSTQATNAKRRAFWLDPTLLISLSAVSLGFLLNFSGYDRPVFFNNVVDLFVPVGTFSLMIAVGLSFQLGSLGRLWKQALLLALAKQFLVPAFAVGLVFLVGAQSVQDGLVLQSLFLLSAMPMAFIVLVPAALYKLDQDLASVTWMLSLIVFILVLPSFPYLLKLLG